MGDSAGLPVAAGLAAGIAFVLVLAALPYFSNNSFGPFPDPDDYSPLIQLKITGLKDTYHAYERIDFAVTQKAAGCVFPETVIVKNLQTGDTVWQFNSARANAMLMGCISMEDDPSDSRMTMNTRDEPPINIGQPGPYAVIAQHQHVRVERQFTVVE